MLEGKNHQGLFGEDYVRVLASAAGLVATKVGLDYDGVDFFVRWPGRIGTAASPGIDVQVKSWSKRRISGGSLQYGGLTEVQFNQLATCDYAIPRYLFLVLVPDDADQYSEVTADGLLLRYQGYHLSLRDQGLITEPNKKRRRTVSVPVSNILTVGALRRLMFEDTGAEDS